MIRRHRIASQAPEDRAVAAYLRTGRYPVRGKSKHFSWDIWTRPERKRTPEAEAARAVAFISSLTHSKGPAAGQPFRLRDWQGRIVRQLFGTLDADGYRQYRTAFVFLPTRSGKTELAAAIAIYLLCGDLEPGGELFSVAVDVDQAALVYNVAAAMVRNDPELSKRLEVIPSRRRILHPASHSAWRVIASDAPSALGVNASGLVMDELAAWPSRDMYDVMTSRTGSRRAPLTVIITTAGSDGHGVGKEVYDYAVKVAAGIIEDSSFLPIIYEAPEGSDPWAEATWYACNPALGDYRSLDEFRIAARQAKEVPGREGAFRRLYLNEWFAATESRWLDMNDWDAGAVPVDAAVLRGRTCYAGLDLSSTSDVTALVLLFPDDEDGFDVVPFFWVPEEGIQKRTTRDRVPYRDWARRGLLEATDGNIVDYDVIRERIRDLADHFDIREIAYDRWGATQLATQLQTDGATVIAFGQGFASMSSPAKELEKLVLGRKLRHAGHPVLRWMASNTVVRMDPAGNIKPDKGKSTEKIDGVVALCMALGRAIVQPKGSAYDERGLLVF